MILDSSAIIAILMVESEAEDLLAKLRQPGPIGVGAPTLMETGIVLTGRIPKEPVPVLQEFLHKLGGLILPFDEVHWHVATDAFIRFGKGRHPAALNFGDCMAYATAKVAGQPLLCIGNDFVQTDLALA
ncbi:MAG: type II toxin-antitoxin system VapC family toxin [Thermoanaerobaculia bacterium]